jgi:hypothetical protein
MRRENECWVCSGRGIDYGETCLTCGGTGDEPPIDTCDGCDCAMKYKRINPRSYYACEDCRDKAYAALGTTHESANVGIKQ